MMEPSQSGEIFSVQPTAILLEWRLLIALELSLVVMESKMYAMEATQVKYCAILCIIVMVIANSAQRELDIFFGEKCRFKV